MANHDRIIQTSVDIRFLKNVNCYKNTRITYFCFLKKAIFPTNKGIHSINISYNFLAKLIKISQCWQRTKESAIMDVGQANILTQMMNKYKNIITKHNHCINRNIRQNETLFIL